MCTGRSRLIAMDLHCKVGQNAWRIQMFVWTDNKTRVQTHYGLDGICQRTKQRIDRIKRHSPAQNKLPSETGSPMMSMNTLNTMNSLNLHSQKHFSNSIRTFAWPIHGLVQGNTRLLFTALLDTVWIRLEHRKELGHSPILA